MTKDEALKMAIEALMVGSKIADTFLPSDNRTIQISKAINACKEALEQPAWQGLTDDEIDAIIAYPWGKTKDWVRAIEQALKEKNT